MTTDELADALVRAIKRDKQHFTLLVEKQDTRLRELQADNARLREALHPGPMPPYVERDAGGHWRFALAKDGTFIETGAGDEWIPKANRYEALTGLDAVTGEKRKERNKP